MRDRNDYAVILVESIGRVLLIEKLLQGAGIACKLIPVPRHLSSDCGSCVRIQRTDRDRAQQILEAARVNVEGIYEA